MFQTFRLTARAYLNTQKCEYAKVRTVLQSTAEHAKASATSELSFAARILTGLRKFDHTSPALNAASWLVTCQGSPYTS